MVHITPLRQSQLLSQIDVVMFQLNNGNFYNGWQALTVLYQILPKLLKKPLKKKFDEVQSEIDAICRDRQLDIYVQRATQQARINMICKTHVFDILGDINDRLESGGYLEYGKLKDGGLA